MNAINLSKLITGILAISIIIIGIYGLLNINFASENFKKTPQEVHTQLLKKEYLINAEDLIFNDSTVAHVLVDLRNQFDFENGHIDGAVNIFSSQILEKEPLKFFRKIEKEGKTIVLYSQNPLETNSSWYLLYKLGFENIKILNAQVNLLNNKLEIKPISNENLTVDIASYIKKSNEVKVETVEIKPIKTEVKKVTPVKKVKVEIEEGGC